MAAPESLSVLSIQKCRRILGPNCKLADSQLQKLRDQLAALADIALHSLTGRYGRESEAVFNRALMQFPREEQEEIAERAAIMEFEGGLKRCDAESAALNGTGQNDWRKYIN